jgi:hypothetical protein
VALQSREDKFLLTVIQVMPTLIKDGLTDIGAVKEEPTSQASKAAATEPHTPPIKITDSVRA